MKNKLPKVFKKKWITALRSGKYKQGAGCLYNKSNDSFCCLGVAETICGTRPNKMHGWGTLDGLDNSRSPLLLRQPMEISGRKKTAVNKLVGFNDNGKSFEWIANWVEKNL